MAGVVIVIVAWALVLVTRTLSAYHHDKRGLAALEQVKSDLAPGTVTSQTSIQLLAQAKAEFNQAQSDLSSPFFAPIDVVPVVGRQFREVKALSTAAGTVSQVGSSFLSQVHDLLNAPHGAGPERVASLRQLASLSFNAERQLADVGTGPSQALVGPLATKRAEFLTQLDDARDKLTRAAGVSAAVASILEGPQTYLVLAANNAEMRAGSGTFLEVGAATTAGGSVHLGHLDASGAHSLPVGAVPVTGDLQSNWGWLHPSLDMRNLGLTPQFDVSAPLAARMWAASTGQQVDGVMALDVVGLQQLLVATGPVDVDGRTVSAEDVVPFLLHDQYAGLSTETGDSGKRQDALGDLASAVLDQLQGQSSDIKALATAMANAVDGRHLMIWSKNPADQAAWVTSGVSGSLAPDSVDMSLINVGGNKLDPFISVKLAATTQPAGPGTEVTLTTRLTNTTPSGQSQYIAGPFPGVPVGYGGYYGVVAANIPAAASHITMTGAGPVAVKGGEGPTWVVGAPLTLPQGQAATVIVHFRMPGSHGSMTVVPSARVPAEQWTANGRTFDDTAPIRISW